MWKEAVVAYFKISQHLHVVTKEIHENLSLYNRSRVQDSKPALLEYEALMFGVR